MQTITLSLFEFDSVRARLWAFSQMGFARKAFASLEGLQFYKMMGAGAGAGFSTRPNFGVYTVLCAWPNEDVARNQLASAAVFNRYRIQASNSATLYLRPSSCRGEWDGGPPFDIDEGTEQSTPVVALTRATLRKRHLRRFWSRVPAISDRAEGDEQRLFMIGMGEVPWLHQVTFSLWQSTEAMEEFALNSKTHGEAVRRAYTEGWFSEYMFARFNLLGVEGTWPNLSADLIHVD